MMKFASAELDRYKVVSALASLEARSAIVRLQRDRLLTLDQASSALDRLEDELKRIVEQPIDAVVLRAARSMVDRHNLRTLDAVQLASAIIARDVLTAPGMRFITSDRILFVAAQAEGFDVWNPTSVL